MRAAEPAKLMGAATTTLSLGSRLSAIQHPLSLVERAGPVPAICPLSTFWASPQPSNGLHRRSAGGSRNPAVVTSRCAGRTRASSSPTSSMSGTSWEAGTPGGQRAILVVGALVGVIVALARGNDEALSD